MTLLTDLQEKVAEFAITSWGDIPNARVIPTPSDLTFGNYGERMDVTILYADVHGSTEMVDVLSDMHAAEYYKAFLHCAAKIIKAEQGEIQAYDGDRIMAVFVGDGKTDRAAKVALQINWAVLSIINPKFASVYTTAHRQLKHTVGIDSGTVLIAKTGVRVDSDLVWVGPAANYAAKLNSFNGLDAEYPTRITDRAFAALGRSGSHGASGALMWEGPYTNLKHSHYRSNYWWPIS